METIDITKVTGNKVFMLVNTSEYDNMNDSASLFIMNENELNKMGYDAEDIEILNKMGIGELYADKNLEGCYTMRII